MNKRFSKNALHTQLMLSVSARQFDMLFWISENDWQSQIAYPQTLTTREALYEKGLLDVRIKTETGLSGKPHKRRLFSINRVGTLVLELGREAGYQFARHPKADHFGLHTKEASK